MEQQQAPLLSVNSRRRRNPDNYRQQREYCPLTPATGATPDNSSLLPTTPDNKEYKTYTQTFIKQYDYEQ